MKKVILTKKRVQALNTALSYDDILFEVFKRQQQDIQRMLESFNRRRQVIGVIQYSNTGKNIIQRKLKILKEYKTPEGIYLEVE